VMGDGDGVLAISPSDLEAIAKDVDAIEKKEAGSLKAIAEGKFDRAWVDKALREKGVL
jgi:regulator of RNase E activity RraA